MRTWLEDKPHAWSHAIALRAALRALPFALLDRERLDDPGSALPLLSLGSVALAAAATAASVRTALGTEPAIVELATSAAWGVAALSASSKDVHSMLSSSEAAHAAIGALRAAASEDWTRSTWVSYSAAADTVVNAAAAMGDTIWRSSTHEIWRAAEVDAAALSDGEPLLSRSLWPAPPPKWFSEAWAQARAQLEAADEDWFVWTGWFERRILGARAGFIAFPRSDDALMLRLAAQGRGFWARPAHEVNRQLFAWIEEAERATDERGPEPQNPLALVFTADGAGRIDLVADAGASELVRDADSADRHAELREAIHRVLVLSSDNTHLYARTTRLLEALGDTEEAIRPGLFLPRADAVRHFLAAQREKATFDDDFPTLSLGEKLAAEDVVSALNVYIALQPALARRDLAMLGPDASRLQIPRDEVRAVLQQARMRRLLADAGHEALLDLVDVAPARPDAEDRRSRSLSEGARNFARQALAMAWRHRTAIALSAPVVLYGLGHFLLVNEKVWLSWFADSPVMLSVIRDMMAFLQRLPLA